MATKKSVASKKVANRTDWFVDARFGMFIHWGLYAMAARHEWVKNREYISNEDYQKYFDNFDPDLFDAKEWAKMAKDAGMKYLVITSKHHEGFCLWDSKYTDYKAPNTPAGRDLLREVVDAFRAEGIHIGFYYSLIDWYHKDFTLDNRHPLRNRPPEVIAELNKGRDMKRYAKYMRDQVTELLTNYGKIDIMWFDFSYPGENGKGHEDWESEKLVKLIRKLQPDIIIDDRLDLPGAGDIVTPEQIQRDSQPVSADGTPLVWEGCQTFSGSWGYYRDEMTWKTDKQCIEMLINHVSRNGNLIMNVGPTARGYFDDRAKERLADYAKWMRYNSRSIYGCGAAPEGFVEPNGCRYTYNAKTNRLYLHIFDWPYRHITLKGLGGKVKYAHFLHDASEIFFASGTKETVHTINSSESDVVLTVPVIQPNVVVPTIELILK